jgi:hypothetical protein
MRGAVWFTTANGERQPSTWGNSPVPNRVDFGPAFDLAVVGDTIGRGVVCVLAHSTGDSKAQGEG